MRVLFFSTLVQWGMGVVAIPSWVFAVLQYLENILPVMYSLSCDLHD